MAVPFLLLGVFSRRRGGNGLTGDLGLLLFARVRGEDEGDEDEGAHGEDGVTGDAHPAQRLHHGAAEEFGGGAGRKGSRSVTRD